MFLGLGTNIGDRGYHLETALQQLSAIVRIEQTSSVYETEPVGHAEQPDFWNLVVRASTDLPAKQLMQELIAIETRMGRERTFRNAPRIIDIDILLYGDVVSSGDELQLPHPRMHERAFVLKPLLEIAPDAVDPRTGARYADLLPDVPAGRVERVDKLRN